MNPVNAKETLKNSLIQYLDRTMPVKEAMPQLVRALEEFQRDQLDFVKPPYLEVSRSYKSCDYSLKDLADRGMLHPKVAEAFASYFGGAVDKIKPYEHQYQSLLQTGAYDGSPKKNLVVCTGTGSGKTECFLLPVIDAIYRQHENAGENYKKHIRAMILYPMNALVNDQVDRLRRILKNLPEITFGRYTGETQDELDSVEINDAELESLNSEWQKLGKADSNYKDESALPNEYLSRSRWSKDGGADILVTNYAMLERLLLLPDNRFFDDCWDFIILDEAHCYTGSTGTEIAWLMRRLERRLRNEAHGRIQYLATSATLSSSQDAEDQKKAAIEFASSIFPVEPSDVVAEFGKIAEVDTTGSVPLTEASLPHFAQRSDVKALYDDTISFERKLLGHEAAGRHVQIIKTITADGRLPAKALHDLSWCFDFPNPIKQDKDIKVDNAIRFLCHLVLKKGKGYDDWREFLHDETLPGGSPIKNDNNASGQRNVRGNRLNILELWKKVDDGEDVSAIDFVSFYYLYLAALALVQNSADLCFAIPTLMISLTDERLSELRQRVDGHRREMDELKLMKNCLNERWRALLDSRDDSLDYHAMIYRAIVEHPDMERYREKTNGKPKAFNELAGDMGLSQSDELKAIINIGALAVQKGERKPLIDVRYHQVVRNVSNVGVYFRNGNVRDPVFVHMDNEYAEGGQGEKIFTFGVCRRCGHPYLLGYAQTRIDGASTVTERLFRTENCDYKFMHALSWLSPISDDDNEATEKDNGVDAWLNLKTGEIATSEVCSPEWVKLKAMLCPRVGDNAFIPKCCACGNEMTRAAKYGIITPYEASGEIYKIAVLDTFATLSDPDNDIAKQGQVTAGGRKVLAFSDSRAAAARLAYRFEQLKERMLLDRLTLELAGDYRPGVSDDTKKEIAKKEEAIANISGMDGSEAIIVALNQQIASLRENVEDNPTISGILNSREGSADDRGLMYVKLNEPRYRYAQLLDFENPQTKIFVSDRKLVSKFLLLRHLRNGSRYNLIRRGIIKVSSATIEAHTAWGCLSNFHSMTEECAKNIARKAYLYLIRRAPVCFDPNSQDEQCLAGELDEYENAIVTMPSFCTCNKTHAIYKMFLNEVKTAGLAPEAFPSNETQNWLAELWRLFTDEWHILRNADNQGGFALNFSQMCDDIQIRTGKGLEKISDILPLVIQEHTAQIDGRMGAIYQRLFADGKVNILSCSTTFEMGIDVGGLNNVFLGNLPPSSSNYRQRAGRAGRRPGAAAYILSLAGNSVHDQNFYEDVPSLFWGEIVPPDIYLDQPVFAARHFRAEAMHSFLKYLNGMNVGSNDPARKWNMVSHFIVGWKFKRGKLDGGKRFPDSLERLNGTCTSYLPQWRNDKGGDFVEYMSGIKDYARPFAHMTKPYSPVDDLIFQFGQKFAALPSVTSLGDYQYYRDLGGCRIPQWDDIAGEMKEGTSPKRQGLEERLKNRMVNYIRQDNDGADIAEDQWGNVEATFAMKKFLQSQTIDMLSETCILPRYGFPTDIIELLPSKDDPYASGVKMQRSLELGMFEYAPGQSVVCNKRRYRSKRVAVSAYPGDTRYSDTLAGLMATSTRYCPQCQKIYDVSDGGNTHCPLCGGPLRNKQYITPEMFFAEKSTKKSDVDDYRGVQVVHWGGRLIAERTVNGLNLRTGESSDRMIQYVNPGPQGRGFDIRGTKCYFVHEVQTNIAIWRLQGAGQLTALGFDDNRIQNACLSAMFAVRRSIAKKLKIATRDIGCLCKFAPETSNYDFVFFDRAAGGGGCAIALVKQGDADHKSEERIREIILGAIRLLRECKCTAGHGDRILTDGESIKRPLALSEYKTRQDIGTVRPSVACYKCLKDFDNQSQHEHLDRWDGLKVLELLLDSAPSESDLYEWTAMQPDDKPTNGGRYKLDDGRVIIFNNEKHGELVQHIIAKEKED